MFVSQHFSSLDDLGIFVTLQDQRNRWWDALKIAAHVGLQPAQARLTLERFAAQNLLDISVTDDIRYRYRPGSAELAEAAAAFEESYRREPVPIVQLVTEHQRRAIADFADAFRIRRHDDR